MKQFNTVKDFQSKTVNSISKTVFLKRCLRFRVVPVTLQVTNDQPGQTQSLALGLPNSQHRWAEVQVVGGLAMVREALVLEEKISSELQS